jgi:hypothetical protein
MKEPPDTENPCTVHPTSELSPTHHYSDMAMTELFTAHVRLFNQEVAGLWQRYNVMLLANSGIFSLEFIPIKLQMPTGPCESGITA